VLIIDRNDDYYDHCSRQLGEDDKAVYDRRGSKLISLSNVLQNAIFSRRHTLFFVLEAGYRQYLFEAKNISWEDRTGVARPPQADIELIKCFDEQKHYMPAPLSLIHDVDVASRYTWRKHGTANPLMLDGSFEDSICWSRRAGTLMNPILKASSLTKFIPPLELWSALSDYVSSLNTEKGSTTPLTDIEKVVNHGFDKKTSFRNPIKL
jgi:hypothetical protein